MYKKQTFKCRLDLFTRSSTTHKVKAQLTGSPEYGSPQFSTMLREDLDLMQHGFPYTWNVCGDIGQNPTNYTHWRTPVSTHIRSELSQVKKSARSELCKDCVMPAWNYNRIPATWLNSSNSHQWTHFQRLVQTWCHAPGMQQILPQISKAHQLIKQYNHQHNVNYKMVLHKEHMISI